jgi:glycosyltransferase involved in cell wall biosynthesis
MPNPLVSIIIPVYNAASFINETINSALQQTWPNKEIIIVDDGSTDDSLILAKKFEGDIVKIFSQQNKGASAARNKGLAEAKGDYIQFLDADDLISANKIEEQINLLISNPGYIGLCATIHFFNSEDPFIHPAADEWYITGSDDPVDFLVKLYGGGLIGPEYGGMIQPNAWLTPAEIIKKAGKWNEELTVDDDGEFFCRMILASHGIKFSEQGLCYYRKFNNRQSLSAQKTEKALKSTVIAIDLKYQHLKEKSTDKVLDKIFAKHYWWTGVLAYPKYKSLSKYCIQKAMLLGYNDEKYVGGPVGHTITKFLGWKAARFIAYYQQVFKRSWI